MSDIKVSWLGHSCVCIEKEGYKIVIDPYQDGTVPGYMDLRVDANEVISTHDHFDHNAFECVEIKEGGESPFAITKLHSFHDENEGADRGKNDIVIISDGQYRIAHAGDIGCMPTQEQIAELGGLDVFFVPVGGHFTMEPEMIKELVETIKPCVTVPMHYRSDEFGFDVIATLDKFTSLCDDVVEYETDTLKLPEDLKKQTAVLKCSRVAK